MLSLPFITVHVFQHLKHLSKIVYEWTFYLPRKLLHNLWFERLTRGGEYFSPNNCACLKGFGKLFCEINCSQNQNIIQSICKNSMVCEIFKRIWKQIAILICIIRLILFPTISILSDWGEAMNFITIIDALKFLWAIYIPIKSQIIN